MLGPMQDTDSAIPDRTDKTPALWGSHLMCYPLNEVAGREASQRASPSSVSSRKRMSLIRHEGFSLCSFFYTLCVVEHVSWTL